MKQLLIVLLGIFIITSVPGTLFTQIEQDSPEEMTEDEPAGNITPPIRSRGAPTFQSSRSSTPPKGTPINLKTSGGTNGQPLTVESFDFQDADLQDITKAISALTGKSFILDKGVKGEISIISNTPVTVEEAYRAFLSSLEVHGFTTVPSGKFFKIIKSRDAKQSGIETYSGEYTPTSDQFITRIFHLKYINAQDIATSLRELTPRGGLIAYPPTNSIILTDTGANIARMIDIIKLLDVKGFKEQLEVLPVKYASASEVASILQQLYEDTSAPGRLPRTIRRTTGTRLTTGGTLEAAPSKIIADERTNSLLILANKDTIENIKSLIAKIDFDVAGGGKIHVYYLQFSDAEQLAQTLSNLASGTTGEKSRKQQETRGATPGIPSITPQTLSSGGVVAEFGDDVKITSDKPTNALVITASPQDYEALKVVIQQLDIPRKQVYLEAAIIELTNTKDSSIGVSYTGGVPNNSGNAGFFGALRTSLVDSLGLFVSGDTAAKGGQIGYVDNHTRTFTIGGSTFTIPLGTAVAQALLTETDANLLSAPRILVLDNEEAKIKVGQKEPVVSGTTLSGTGLSQSNIERIPVSLELKITPQINEASDFVKLKVEQSIEALISRIDIGANTSSVRTTERSVESTVVVKDNDTVVLGGLMQDNVRETEAKIPLLGDIPLLGWLFKTRSTDVDKTNLVLLLTPRIIHKAEDFRNLFDNTLKERESFVERNAVGEDRKDWYFNNNTNPPSLK